MENKIPVAKLVSETIEVTDKIVFEGDQNGFGRFFV